MFASSVFCKLVKLSVDGIEFGQLQGTIAPSMLKVDCCNSLVVPVGGYEMKDVL